MDREETFNLELNNEDTKKFKVSFGETTYVGEPGGAVDSVNGMTGDVVLTTSDLENTSDYQTGTEVTEAINMAVSDEADIRQNADNDLQSQIDGITASSDVTDIVGTYADLQDYDTSTLSDNDIIKVLQDETHQDETTYYRWNSTTQEFTLIGEEGPYYTKAQTDVLLQDKQDTLTAGNNITIDNNNEISATDTTYSDFVGTDGTAVGTAGLVPAPAIADVDKFLKSDGTWEEVGGGITELTSADYNWPTSNPDGVAMWLLPDGIYKDLSLGGIVYPDTGASKNLFQMFIKYSTSTDSIIVYYDPAGHRWRYWQTKTSTGARVGYGTITPKVVQTTGTSTTDVMSQNATTGMVFADPSTRNNIQIGSGATAKSGNSDIVIGHNAKNVGDYVGIAIGENAVNSGANSIAIGRGSLTNNVQGAIALGFGAHAMQQGEMNIGASSNLGYNNTNYRLLSGLHDPVNAHDASTKGYVDNIVVNYAGLYNTGAPTTSTKAYYLGQFYYDTTNDALYYCSAIDETTDPDNPVYTWTALPSGGGGDTVYSTVTTSNASNGGAVYIGDLDANQQVVPDPTATDNHYKYFWALPYSTTQRPANNTVNIMGQVDTYSSNSVSILGLGSAQDSVEIGDQAWAEVSNSVAIGKSSHSKNTGVAIGQSALGPNYSVSIGGNAGLYSAGSIVSCVNIGYQAGYSSQAGNNFAVNLGAFSRGTRKGEVNVGLVTGNTTGGYNDTAYRVIGGVHDGQLPQDVATVSQINATIDAINTALSTSIPHIGASS